MYTNNVFCINMYLAGVDSITSVSEEVFRGCLGCSFLGHFLCYLDQSDATWTNLMLPGSFLMLPGSFLMLSGPFCCYLDYFTSTWTTLLLPGPFLMLPGSFRMLSNHFSATWTILILPGPYAATWTISYAICTNPMLSRPL